MRTLASSDRPDIEAPLLHVIDGRSDDGRIRRAERLRLDLGGHVIVVGGLEEECRCAEIGLQSIGSTPWHNLSRTVTRTILAFKQRHRVHPVPIAWSARIGIELAEHCSRVVLVADGPPDRSIDPEVSRRIDVIAPDQVVARDWADAGVLKTRIVEPCCLPAGASVSTDESTSLRVLVLPGALEGQSARTFVHQVGMAALCDAPVQALLDEGDPGYPETLAYVKQVGMDASLAPMKRIDSRGQIALVGCAGSVSNDERVLDLLARGIGVLAVVPAELLKVMRPCGGVELFSAADGNAVTRRLLELATDPARRVEFQLAARSHATTRDPRAWSSVMGVASATGATV